MSFAPARLRVAGRNRRWPRFLWRRSTTGKPFPRLFAPTVRGFSLRRGSERWSDGAEMGGTPPIPQDERRREMSETATKLLIRNVGLMLSGKLEAPILDADAVLCDGGEDRRGGQARRSRHDRRHGDRGREGRDARSGVDRQPYPPGDRRLHPAPASAPLDRLHPPWRRDHLDFRRRGAFARPAEGRRRPEGARDRLAALVRRLSPLGREGPRRRAGDRTRARGA